MTSEPQQISHQCRIFFLPDLRHALFKEFSCFPSMHLHSVLCHRIFGYKINKTGYPDHAVRSGTDFRCFGSDAVILRKVSGKPFFQKDHVRMLWAFLSLLFCFLICPAGPGKPASVRVICYTSSFSWISSSASALKSSSWTGSISGRSSSPWTPKQRRNSSVVPRRIGRPGASRRPSSLTRS